MLRVVLAAREPLHLLQATAWAGGPVSNRGTASIGTLPGGKDPLCHGEEWTSGDTDPFSAAEKWNIKLCPVPIIWSGSFIFKIKTQICVRVFYRVWVSSAIQSFGKKKKKKKVQTVL